MRIATVERQNNKDRIKGKTQEEKCVRIVASVCGDYVPCDRRCVFWEIDQRGTTDEKELV